MMTQTGGKQWRLFDILGNAVYLSPYFLVLVAIFSFMPVRGEHQTALAILRNLLVWVPTLFGGILLHEVGHAVAIKYYGYGSSKIVLHGIGGVTINERRGHASPKNSIVISLAGPFVSLALAFLGLGLYAVVPASGALGLGGAGAWAWNLLVSFLRIFGLINLVWGLFNLFPVNPLDGGQVLLNALRAKFGNRRKAMYYTSIISLGALVAMVVVGIAVGLQVILLLLIAGMLGIQNYRQLQSLKQGPPRGPRGRSGGGYRF